MVNPNQPGRGDCRRFLIELKEAHKENNEGKRADLITSIEKRCDAELFNLYFFRRQGYFY